MKALFLSLCVVILVSIGAYFVSQTQKGEMVSTADELKMVNTKETTAEMSVVFPTITQVAQDALESDTESQDLNIVSEALSNEKKEDMTIVLSVPSVHDSYYAEVFDQIVDFHVGYANTIYDNDDVIILADSDTRGYLEGRVPNEIIREAEVFDIWMRDFTTVNPYDPVQFLYEGEYFPDIAVPQEIQQSFSDFAAANSIGFRTSDYVLDGGNVVDNYRGSIVVSERFLEENDLTFTEGQEVLKNEYGATHVAVIPYDDEIMGHADGMVMFVDDVLFVNKYDEPFRSEVIDALERDLPESTKIVEVAADFEVREWKDFASACGININSLVTADHVYIPMFGNTATDQAFVEAVAAHTDKQIHTVDAQNVCFMGGSVRCLSWQIANLDI